MSIETKPESTENPTGNAARTRIEFRCTPAEKDTIVSLAGKAGADVSDYCRGRALRSDNQAKGKAQRLEYLDLLAQLGKIGSNVNQLARATNAGRTVPDAAILSALQEIERCGEALRASLRGDKIKASQ